MIRLSVRHKTAYRYSKSVVLHPHRLMLRPRESRELRLLSMKLTTEPRGNITWAQDVAGNTVATASFSVMSDSLTIDSVAEIELDAEPWPIFGIAASAISYPFFYSDNELADLGATIVPLYPDSDGRLREWVKTFVRSNPTDTLSLLKDLNAGIAAAISYQSRDEEGTQHPLETLTRKSGSCRDLAVLFVEAVRILGFGARIVSGYLHNLNHRLTGFDGAGSTHAWAEVYVPGAGWITFDPTNASVGGVNLIPVAVGRGIAHVAPVAGSFAGVNHALKSLSVEVVVTPYTLEADA